MISEQTPDTLSERFFHLSTAEDIADYLDIPTAQLHRCIHAAPEANYTTFELPKRSGGTRQITAPCTFLKELQQKLNTLFQSVYKPPACVHGYTRERNVLTNAMPHAGKDLLLNIDLKDFFPSINFGRVRSLLMKYPYLCPEKAATVLAGLCCVNNCLPQGAPTSPVLSNMLCKSMDEALLMLAEKNHCSYTRYADDMTFSYTGPEHPKPLIDRASSGGWRHGDQLLAIINEYGFEVNHAKTRCHRRNRRLEVTGLVVNEFPNVTRSYVREVRGMLHALEKFGPEKAQKVFDSRGASRSRTGIASFLDCLFGKLLYLKMIRGVDRFLAISSGMPLVAQEAFRPRSRVWR